MTPAPDRVERLRAAERPIDSVRDLLRRAIAHSTIRLVEAEPIVRDGEDPEGVHAARVGVRHLRSDLKTFGPLLDRGRTEPLRAELSWLAGLLGPVREADLLEQRLRRRIVEAEGELAPAKVLVDELEAVRLEARVRLLRALDSARYSELLDALEASATAPPTTGEGDRPARRAGRAIAAPWSALRRRARRLGPGATDGALHEVRIRAKRVRYAAEAVSPAFGKRAVRFAEAAATLQGVLGDHQDAVVASAWLAEHALDAADPSVAFAAGRLAEQEAIGRARARDRWPRAWQALRAEGPFWS